MDYCYKRGNKQGKLGQKERKNDSFENFFWYQFDCRKTQAGSD